MNVSVVSQSLSLTASVFHWYPRDSSALRRKILFSGFTVPEPYTVNASLYPVQHQLITTQTSASIGSEQTLNAWLSKPPPVTLTRKELTSIISVLSPYSRAVIVGCLTYGSSPFCLQPVLSRAIPSEKEDRKWGLILLFNLKVRVLVCQV